MDEIAGMVFSLRKTSSKKLVYHIFDIVGKLFENVREWCSFHADILSNFGVIQVLNGNKINFMS